MIFRRLLLYLYGAPVDKSVGVDQICELMLLADRYSVDNLKDICENTLIASIDSDSVIYLFGISDRFNASSLKASCLSYLSQHTELTKLEIFSELPGYLQVIANSIAMFHLFTSNILLVEWSTRPNQVVWTRTGALERSFWSQQTKSEKPFSIQVITFKENVSLIHVTMMCQTGNTAHQGYADCFLKADNACSF